MGKTIKNCAQLSIEMRTDDSRHSKIEVDGKVFPVKSFEIVLDEERREHLIVLKIPIRWVDLSVTEIDNSNKEA